MRRIKAGDTTSFAEFYKLTSRHVFGTVLRVCRQQSVAEDVVQDIYLSLWHGKAGFDAERGHPLGWLTTVARHKAIDSIRRARPEAALRAERFNAEDDPYQGLESSALNPFEQCMARSTDDEIGRCLAALSPVQRQCMSLAFYHGLSYSEVAVHLDHPIGTVKSHVRRALTTIRGSFGAGAPSKAATAAH